MIFLSIAILVCIIVSMVIGIVALRKACEWLKKCEFEVERIEERLHEIRHNLECLNQRLWR